MLTRMLAVVLLTAAATPPARSADDPVSGLQAINDEALKRSAELEKLIEELKVSKKAADKEREAAHETRHRADEVRKMIEELLREKPKDGKTDPKPGDKK
jgi:hypothetical protein